MPPKKAPKPSPPSASTRSSRSQTKAATAPAVEGESAKSSTGKRKRAAAALPAVVMSDSDSEVEQVKSRAKAAPKKKAAASPAKKQRTTAAKKKANAPFTQKACERWFETLEDPDSPGSITHNTIPGWLEDLGVSPEGIVFYVIAWICQAKHTFTISREEFLVSMGALSIDSNEALLRKLPTFLKEVAPALTSPIFDKFYKFCFSYFKPTDVKNLTIEVASELLTSLLDPVRYSLQWIPPLENEVEEPGETKGDFPHRKAFVEFLGQGTVQVITRDQYEQFVPFNRDVPWNLEGFKEEESTWPTLMDTYIGWRKEKYPLPEKKEAEDMEE